MAPRFIREALMGPCSLELSERLRRGRATVELEPEEIKRLWILLADSETTKAYRASATLLFRSDPGDFPFH